MISKETLLHLPNPITLLRRGHRVAAVAATLLATGALGVLAPASMAGNYHHISLGYYGQNNNNGWTPNTTQNGGGYVQTNLTPSEGIGSWNVLGGRSVFRSGEVTQLTYTAPANTTISAITFTDRLTGFASGDWATAGWNGGNEFHLVTPTPDAAAVYGYTGLTGNRITLQQQCLGPSNACYANENARFEIYNTDVLLSDATTPSAGTPVGGLVADGRLTGTESLAIPATDTGSGLYLLGVYDGSARILDQYINNNNGHCVDITGSRFFDTGAPCVPSATAEASIDTTSLTDGQHTLKAYIYDASGNSTLALSPITKVIANHPPVNTALPAPASSDPVAVAAFTSPHTGQTITLADATWTGPSLTKTLAWLRCDTSGLSCVQIPAATSLSYTPTTDDIGHTLRLSSTATNAADTVTVQSSPSGVITAPKSASDVTDKPATPDSTGSDSTSSTTTTSNTTNNPAASVALPGLPANNTTNNYTHTVIGRVAGEPAGVACPGDKATLKFQHIKGGSTGMRFGKASTAQLELTCTTTGKAITGAKLEIATKTGAQAAAASDVTTDGAGHATIRLAKGASRGITVGYRMYADDTTACAIATLKVLVTGKITIKANKKSLHNGQAVTLRGSVAGGLVPKRGVSLAVQWKDGKRWRPFAQIKTNKSGKFAYAYKFTRTNRKIRYQLRVTIARGQVDYPFVAASSKAVRVTVAP